MARWFPGATISRVHGRAHQIDGRFVVPMYHPAAALHRGDLRAVIEADFSQLRQLLDDARSQPAPAPAATTAAITASARAGGAPPAPFALAAPSRHTAAPAEHAGAQGQLL